MSSETMPPPPPMLSQVAARNGRMAACGHTSAQTLHCEHASGCQTGTEAAIARRSTSVMPGGTNPPKKEVRGKECAGRHKKVIHPYGCGIKMCYHPPHTSLRHSYLERRR